MKRILIIDDDEIFEFITRELIAEMYPDSEIKSFLSSSEGLNYIMSSIATGDNLPDILLLDIRMPEMDGFELLDELAKKHNASDLEPMKIFMLTSSLDAKDYRMSTENALVSGFISKPLEAEKLHSLMA
ncbi:MAG: response regulator [Bacteroidota bacterium]|jgi:CheY-like chemotaxis protein